MLAAQAECLLPRRLIRALDAFVMKVTGADYDYVSTAAPAETGRAARLRPWGRGVLTDFEGRARGHPMTTRPGGRLRPR